MKTLIRYLVIGVTAAVLFLVASVAIFIAVFDANAYKDDLSGLVREQTGRDLQFHGDVSLTVFPALGMKLGAMSFSNPAEFGAQPMIKVSEASISVDVASLITFAPEIDKLVLRDLEVNLITNKSGKTNWEDLLQPAPPGTTPAVETESSAPAEPAADFELKGAFGGLDLQNIKLLWLDEQAGQEYRITDLDLSTGRIEPNKPFALTLHLVTSGDVEVEFDFAANVEYLIAEQRLTLSELLLKLNEFEISGQVQLSDFSRPTPALRFELASQDLDVDALLGIPPAQAEGPQAAQTSDSAEEDVQITLPMQTLRDLDIDGTLKIDRLKVQNLQLSDLEIPLKAERGLVTLRPIKLEAYGGSSETSVVVDVRSEVPKYGISETASGLQIGALLKDFTGEDTILGSFDASANLTTAGEWLSELKRNSNGTLELGFADGALNGFNLRHSIDTAKAKLRGKEPPAQENLKTDFSSLSLSGVIEDGVFSSSDLNLQAPLLRVGGSGSADLNTETVDYLVNAKLVGTVEGQAGEVADELAGLAIPVAIEGPFTAPEIDVKLDEMLKARADAEKEKLKQEIAREKEALQQQLEAEKKALAESRKKEIEKRKEIERAKLKQKKKAEQEKLKNELLQKLQD